MKKLCDQRTQERSLEARARRHAWFEVDDSTWQDWRWQQAKRIRRAEELEQYIALSKDEKQAIAGTSASYRMAITPYYLTLIDPFKEDDPIRRQAIPSLEELSLQEDELDDPLGEDKFSPVPGVTHRYPDRVLLYTTHNCPVYCRHCNRRRKVSMPETMPAKNTLDLGIEYIAEHREIRDVLISGGDPLTFSDHRLEDLLKRLHAIEHLEMIRLATRNPVTLPQRITPELVNMFRKYHPIYISTHFNHPAECTQEAAWALSLLADAGCVLNNQMVLLKGVNDDPAVVFEMNQWLLRHRCRPYYIFQLDTAQGISHFRTPLASGVDIIKALRGWTSGLAVPHYVVDLPGGGGKVSVQPNYLEKKNDSTYLFRNYKGDLFEYKEGC